MLGRGLGVVWDLREVRVVEIEELQASGGKALGQCDGDLLVEGCSEGCVCMGEKMKLSGGDSEKA